MDIVSFAQKLNSSISDSIRVCMPGSIDSYDFKTQKANVKISMKELYSTGKEVDYPIVNNVPVVFLSAGGASITLPVNRGDTCLLIFADRDMSAWLRGAVGHKPDSTRAHNLSDAIAIMGLQPFTKVGSAKNNEDLAINYAGANISITKNGEVNITTTKAVNITSIQDVNVKSNENVNIEAAKNVNITSTENSLINSKNLTITASESVTTNCKNAVLVASEEIKTTATKFTHTGNLIITGDLELEGSGSGKSGAPIKFSAGITNEGTLTNNGNVTVTGSISATSTVKSGSVSLSTHTHSYVAPLIGSTPTAGTPGTTGTPT